MRNRTWLGKRHRIGELGAGRVRVQVRVELRSVLVRVRIMVRIWREPAVVLEDKLEVGEGDGDETGDEQQHRECQSEDAEEGVHLVAPHAA